MDLYRIRRGSCSIDLKLGFCYLIFVSSLLVTVVESSIHEYKNQSFTPRLDSFFFHGGNEGLYTSNKFVDTTTSNVKSSVRFDSVTFRRTKKASRKHQTMQRRTGLIEAILFEVKDKDRIGGSFVGLDELCCTPELAKVGNCNVGEVFIHRKDDDEWPKRIQTFFQGQEEEAKMTPLSVEVNSSGMYHLYFMYCDPELKDTVINGKTIWRNPDGFLPGYTGMILTVYGYMCLCHLILGLLWFVWVVSSWKDVFHLHYYIGTVIALGISEMTFWYLEYANFNSTAARPGGLTMWVVTFSSVSKTISRLLLLLVSMGFGIVNPTNSGIASNVLLLSVMYFLASEALGLVENMGNTNDFSQFSGRAKLFLMLPVALLNVCFILWIFSSLSKTMQKLQMRRSIATLKLYRRLTYTLAACVLISVKFWIDELYFYATDPWGELWRNTWIIQYRWSGLSFLLLFLICVWIINMVPSGNLTRYEHSGEDKGGISLTACSSQDKEK